MWQKIGVKLTGISPLVMHNGQLCDPMNPVVIEIKKISGKRVKTEADYKELARLEFQGGLYMNGNGPCIPAHVIETTFVNGAKKSKDGPKAKSGMFIEKAVDLNYEGVRDREGLWADEKFRLVQAVVISRARIMRTRPIFEDWFVEVVVNYDDQQANRSQIIKWIEDAGIQVGFCEMRPRYGRFKVKVIN